MFWWGGHCCPMHCDLFKIYCVFCLWVIPRTQFEETLRIQTEGQRISIYYQDVTPRTRLKTPLRSLGTMYVLLATGQLADHRLKNPLSTWRYWNIYVCLTRRYLAAHRLRSPEQITWKSGNIYVSLAIPRTTDWEPLKKSPGGALPEGPQVEEPWTNHLEVWEYLC